MMSRVVLLDPAFEVVVVEQVRALQRGRELAVEPLPAHVAFTIVKESVAVEGSAEDVRQNASGRSSRKGCRRTAAGSR
jgi:hypothetical protein